MQVNPGNWKIENHKSYQVFKNEKGWHIKKIPKQSSVTATLPAFIRPKRYSYMVYPSINEYIEGAVVKEFEKLIDAQEYVARMSDGGKLWEYNPSVRQGVFFTSITSTLIPLILIQSSYQSHSFVEFSLLSILFFSGIIGAAITSRDIKRRGIHSKTPRHLFHISTWIATLLILTGALTQSVEWQFLIFYLGVAVANVCVYISAVNEKLPEHRLLLIKGGGVPLKDAKDTSQIQFSSQVAALYGEVRGRLIANAQAAQASSNAHWQYEAERGLELLDEITQTFMQRVSAPLNELATAYAQIERIATAPAQTEDEAERAWQTWQAYLNAKSQEEFKV